MDAKAIIQNFSVSQNEPLDLGGLGLDTLPEEMEKLPAGVHSLWLASNAFTEPPMHRLATMASLKVLGMESNRLTTVKSLATRADGVLANLQVLHLDQNQITVLDPRLFSSLPKLQWLSASNNQISSLPPEVGFCTLLEGLRLSHNNLITMPEEIGSLSNLLCIDLEHNRLKSLPHSIGHLTKLEGLLLEIQR